LQANGGAGFGRRSRAASTSATATVIISTTKQSQRQPQPRPTIKYLYERNEKCKRKIFKVFIIFFKQMQLSSVQFVCVRAVRMCIAHCNNNNTKATKMIAKDLFMHPAN